MLPVVTPVLADPPTDRPAAADPATLRGILTQRRRAVLVLVLGGGVALGVPALGVSAGNDALRWTGIVLGALLEGAWVCWVLPSAGRQLWWLRGLRRAVIGLRWRQVRAGLVRGGPDARCCVVMVEDGARRRLLELRGTPWEVQLAIAYAGRIWLLGPDAAGRQGAAEPGGRTPYRVRVLEQLPPGDRPAEPATGLSGSAADEPVTAAAAAARQRLGLIVAGGGAGCLLWGLLVAVAAPLPGLLWAAACAAGLAAAWREHRHLPDLLRGLRLGQWAPVPIRLAAWPETARRTATVHGEIRLLDGRQLQVELPGADELLVANIRAGGRLWFAGGPQPGRINAIGIPGTPILGVARVG